MPPWHNRPVAAEWPLIGRSAELERVLDRLHGPAPGAVVVAGAAGVGKTRLSLEARRAIEAEGGATARAVASRAAASIPFGAFAPLLPRSDAPLDGRLDLLRQAAEALAQRARPVGEGPHRLFLFVDDAHLLDDGSAALLLQVAPEPWCRLVVTVRSGEAAPDPVTALWKDGLAERLELQALSLAEAEAFIAAVLVSAGGDGGTRRPIEGASVHRLWEAARGNPLYLREVVLGALEGGSFVLEGGVWHLAGRVPAPPRLVELVSNRLEGVGEEGRRVLDHLAVADVLGLALLEELTGAAAIDDVERRGLIAVSADGNRQQVRLAHPLYSEVLRNQLPVLAARRIRRALADAVSAAGALRREDVLQVATWRLDTGTPTDGAFLLEAARQAQRVFESELVERLARAARKAGAGVPAGVVQAEAFFELGRHKDAEKLLAVLTLEAATDEERAKVANARAHNLSNYLDRQDDAAAVVEAAMAAVGDPALKELLASRLAVLQLFNGRPTAALDAAEHLLTSDTTATFLRATYVGGIALAELGRHERAREVSIAGHRAHEEHPDASPQPPEVQHIGRVMAAVEAGWLDEATTLAAASYATMVERGQREGQATFAMFMGMAAVARGDLVQADRAFREGAAVNRELHDDLALRWCVSGTAMAAGMAGDTAVADEAAAELAQLPPPSAQLMGIELLGRAQAWMAVARGEVSAGRARLLVLADDAVAHHQRAAAIACLHDAARLGDHSVAARLRALADEVDGPLAGVRADHAAGLAAEDPRAVDGAAARFEEMGALLLAAEAFTEAARLYRVAGLLRAAGASERRAASLLTRCPGARTPVLVGVVASGAALTAREREIAALAASGLSSKDIAARLVVSARTVDNHLQRVYSKLGITGRDQLPSVLAVDSTPRAAGSTAKTT